MIIDEDKIKEMVTEIDKALSFFVSPADSESKCSLHWEWQSRFVSLDLDLSNASHKDNKLSESAKLIRNININMNNIGTIIHRLNWHRSASIEKEFLETMWRTYASIDIEHFHIELRSIMDYVAKIVIDAADKPDEIPKKRKESFKSFRSLLEWIEKYPKDKKLLGEDLASVVETAKWFRDLRCVRDYLIHKGGFTITFGSRKDGILFHLYKRPFEAIKNLLPRHLMFNDNVMYFEIYAAIFLSHILVFLDRLAELIYKKYQL